MYLHIRVISKNITRPRIVGNRVTTQLVARKWQQKIMAPEAVASNRQTARSNDPNGSLLGRLD